MTHTNRIGKIEASRRQVDTAIELYFEDKDGLSIYTLAYASFKLLFDIYPYRRSDDFYKKMNDLIENMGWKSFNKIGNFLKHADKDPFEVLDGHENEYALPIIGFVATLHHRLTGFMSPQMRAFDAWIHVLNPDVFDLPRDQDPEFEKKFRESIKVLKEAPIEVQLMLGKALIAFYTDNPNAKGFGAPRDPVTLNPL